MNGIMRVEKRKMQAAGGIQAENNREADKPKDFVASDIDWNRTNENIFFVKSNNFRADIKKELHNHGIDKWRKDAVTFIDAFYGASPEFFEDKSIDDVKKYFEDCLAFHKRTYGDHIINAVIHLDETTPHMQVISVPIVENFKDDQKSFKLSAKELMGNIKTYTQRQDRFYEEVSKQYGLERGERNADREAKREHLSVLDYKAQETAKTLEQSIESLEANKKDAVIIQQKLEEKKEVVNSLDKSIEARESRLTSLDGSIKKAKDLKKEIADKDLLGRPRNKVTIGYDEYRSLQKTARKVDDVEWSEKQLQDREKEFQDRVDRIEPNIKKADEKLRKATKELKEAQQYKNEEIDYINGTAERIAQQKLDEFIKSLGNKNQDKLQFLEERLSQYNVGGKPLNKILDKEFDDHIKEIQRRARAWDLEL